MSNTQVSILQSLMIAWALSGGGSRGPIQVGAMRALFERSIVPDILVGTSAGALNSAYIAAAPTAAANETLAQLWMGTRTQDVFPKPRFVMILRALLFRNGLDNNKARMRTFMRYLPDGVTTFGDLKAKLYLTAADLQTGRLYLYGDDPSARLIDACLSSTALPVVWDPEIINGHQFVDGGVVANVPISIAMDRGATTIYALDLQNPGPFPEKKGVIEIALHAIGVQTYQQAMRDVARALLSGAITLHYISFGDIFSNADLRDFSNSAAMIEQGYARAKQYLDRPTPNVLPDRFGIRSDSVTPPGAALYEPRF